MFRRCRHRMIYDVLVEAQETRKFALTRLCQRANVHYHLAVSMVKAGLLEEIMVHRKRRVAVATDKGRRLLQLLKQAEALMPKDGTSQQKLRIV